MNIKIHEFESFCGRWIDKANSYPDDLSGCFDKFTSLYVVFNRVYTEVGEVLVERGELSPSCRRKEKELATSEIVNYYGELILAEELRNNQSCNLAVESLAKLILENRFYLHTNYKTGNPAQLTDEALAEEARRYQPKSILKLIYRARCNLFHGKKGFEEEQRMLIDNMSIIVEFITKKVLERLKKDLKHPIAV